MNKSSEMKWDGYQQTNKQKIVLKFKMICIDNIFFCFVLFQQSDTLQKKVKYMINIKQILKWKVIVRNRMNVKKVLKKEMKWKSKPQIFEKNVFCWMVI